MTAMTPSTDTALSAKTAPVPAVAMMAPPSAGPIARRALFGFFAALQTLVGILPAPGEVPSSFLSMLPYLATILAVAGFVGRVRPPAASGEPYPA